MEETHVTAAPVVLTIPGSDETLELVCMRAVTVHGRVLDPGGAPVEGRESSRTPTPARSSRP